MIEVEVSIQTKQSPYEVFEFWGDHSNNPKWQKGQRSCVWTSDPPIGIGSTYDQEAAMLGRPIISSFECVEFEPGAMIRMKTTKSTMPLDITRAVSPGPSGGTTLNAIIRGEPTGFMRMLNPLMKRMVERNVNKDYQRLKELLDADADVDA
ncbi:MAG: SRPBCC family protein [Acidimicrobiales bacterium]